MKKYLSIVCLIVSLFLSARISAQPMADEEKSLVKWMTWKEAFEANKKTPKPFLVDFYTSWCGWCKHMMKTTYSVPQLADYINTYFYPVKFDAETQDTIEYLGEKYVNKGKEKRSVHQLASKLLGENISYPTTLFMNGYADNKFRFSLLSAGFMEVKKVEPLLVYTLENVFNTTKYEDFQKQYELAFYDTSASVLSKDLKRYTMNEALELNKKEPRKILVDVYTNWCNSCRIMNRMTLRDTTITKYLNKHFYLVDFNAENKDVINFMGQQFKNDGSTGPFHPFIMTLLKGHLTLPTILLLGEDTHTIDAIPFYLTAETLNPVLKFYGENAYKTVSWQDYKAKFKE